MLRKATLGLTGSGIFLRFCFPAGCRPAWIPVKSLLFLLFGSSIDAHVHVLFLCALNEKLTFLYLCPFCYKNHEIVLFFFFTFSDLRSSSLFFLFCFFGFWHTFPAKKFEPENMCRTMLLAKMTLPLDMDLLSDQAWISSSHCCFILSYKKNRAEKNKTKPNQQTKSLLKVLLQKAW